MAALEACIRCGELGVANTDSRPHPEGRYRRKRCRACGHRWGTLEVPFEAGAGISIIEDALAAVHQAEAALAKAKAALARYHSLELPRTGGPPTPEGETADSE